MKIQSVTVGAFEENTYLVIDEQTLHGVLVDPGDEADRILGMVRKAGVTLDAIWLTHGHLDHVGAIAAIKREMDVPVHMHPLDRVVYDRSAEVAAMYGLPFEQPAPPDVDLAEGDRLTIGAVAFDVMHLPGHAPGHVIFVGEGVVLGGDVLFAGSIGRTDLPFADPQAMQRSLARIAALDESLVVYPGHGPPTTIGRERATNGFLTGLVRLASR